MTYAKGILFILEAICRGKSGRTHVTFVGGILRSVGTEVKT